VPRSKRRGRCASLADALQIKVTDPRADHDPLGAFVDLLLAAWARGARASRPLTGMTPPGTQGMDAAPQAGLPPAASL
jgi:hypothetical protein